MPSPKAGRPGHQGGEGVGDLPKLTHCGVFSWAFFHQTFGPLDYWNFLFPSGETEALNEDNIIYCFSFITFLKDV